jgi:DNA-binding SARP family transcriptional activator
VESKRWDASFPSTLSASAHAPSGTDVPTVVVRVLGLFAMDGVKAGHDDKLWQRAHVRRLLQMVASNAKLREPRSKVLRILWPDLDDAHARNRLHHTVHLIRKGMDGLLAANKPILTVDAQFVTLTLPPNAVVDAQQFILALGADARDDASRLDTIDRALRWYRGEFAPDWLDATDMTARRAWFAQQHEAAMAEAISLAVQLHRFDQALKFAKFRAQLLPLNVDAQCEYAALLAQHGRADAALAHCHSARASLAREDDAASSTFDALERSIQQQVNQAKAGVQAAAPAPRQVQSVGQRQMPVRQPLLGYDTALATTLHRLRDPHTSLVSLVGPPGVGKTALALEVAHRCQSDFLHGVLWVDCQSENDQTHGLLSRLALGLNVPANDTDVVGAITRALHGKEMLVVLDGLTFGAQQSGLLPALLCISRDVRWLATAWSSFNIAYEKAVLVDSSDLLQTMASDAWINPAMQLLSCMGSHAVDLQDKRTRTSVQALVTTTGGLPVLLSAAARALQSALPEELNAKLARDPSALLSSSTPGGDAHASALVRWLAAAPLPMQRLLSVASRCQSWLTRLDLTLLLDADDPNDVDALIDTCASMHWLQRRVRQDPMGSWSEFKVPAYAQAALTFCEGAVPSSDANLLIEGWLNHSALVTAGGIVHQAHTDAQWFDDRIQDYQATIQRWFAEGRPKDVAALCFVHARNWSTAKHKAVVMGWLTQLGERMEGIDDEIAAYLLLERARLREDFGNIHGAFDDANRALARVADANDPTFRQEAARLTERYGTTALRGDTRSPAVHQRGIEAGEGLLRVAKLAAKHGEPQRAMKLCSEAATVLSYFGLGRGVLKAHHYRARIAYAMGDTELSMRCITQCERTARSIGEHQEVAVADLMRANVLSADMQHGQAIDLSSAVLAKPAIANNPHLLSRGLLALGWAYYAAGAFPVLRAMSQGLIDQARLSGEPTALISAKFLTMLAHARTGQQQRAVEHIGPVLQLLDRHTPLPDVQGELANVADLVVHLDQPALAESLMQALDVFGSRRDHQLRPWTQHRVDVMRGLLARQPAVANAPLFLNSQEDASVGTVLQKLLQA